MTIERIGSKLFINGTRIDCTFRARPSVTGAKRLQNLLRVADEAKDLCYIALNAPIKTKDGLRHIDRKARSVLELANEEV